MRRAVVVAGVLLALSSPARADVFDALAIAGAASDVVTTEAALRRGFVESNLQNRGARVGANVLLTGGMLLAARELKKSGHPGWSKALKLATAAGWGYIAARNVRTMQGGIGR
jgi:hypothetical protein